MQGSSLSSIQMRIQKQQREQNSFNLLKFKIGHEPHYIEPKHSQATTSQPQFQSESQFNSSLVVPKFHNPSIAEQVGMTTKPFKNKKNQVFQEFSQLQSPKHIPQSTLSTLVNFLIWIFYIIGSIDFSNQSVSSFHIVDLIGNGFALLLLFLTIYNKKQISSFSQILHIWSILLTITFLAYPINTSSSPQPDKIFIQAINILRSLRLAFPFFIRQSPVSVLKKMLQLAFKSKKMVAFVLIVCFLLGFFCFQTFSDSATNRCRSAETPYTLNTWDPVDQRLCGQRTCPTGTYCRNVKLFGPISVPNQNIPKNLESGLYSFDSSSNSAVSVFQMFTLNQWGRISQIYFDTYPAWISVPFYIIGWIMFEKLFMALIVLFYDTLKQKREKLDLLTQGQKNKPKQHNLIRQDQVKLQLHDVTISRVQSERSLFSQKNGISGQNQVLDKQEMGIKQKIFFYCLAIVISVTQIALVSQFGLRPSKIDDDMYNRQMGVILSVFFILHFIALTFAKNQLSESTQETTDQIIQTSTIYPDNHQYGMTKNQTIETILSLESFIFYISLADYIMRLVEGKYILEEKSGLTNLTHFAIAFRIYYVYLAAIDIFALNSLQSHLVTCVKTLKSIFRYVLGILVCAMVLGTISFYINRDNYSKEDRPTGFVFETNRFLMFLVNHSWQSLFKFPVWSKSVNQQSLFVQIGGVVCVIIGSMVFLRFIISHIVHQAFWESLNGNQKCGEEQYIQSSKKIQQKIQSLKQHPMKPQNNTSGQGDSILKSEKSFFIFGFDNCVRQMALQIVKSSSYQKVIKFRLYPVYILANVICCIVCNSKVYGIISVALQAFVLIDILLSAVALRFAGKFSYTQNKLTNILHFLFTIIVIVLGLLEVQIHFIPFIQITRIILILNSFESFKETFVLIQSIYKTVFLHFLILIPILLGYALIMVLLISGNDQSGSFIMKITEGFKLSLIFFCQKGWDINRIFGSQTMLSLFGQLTIFSMIITWISVCLSLFYSLAGILISLMIKVKQSSEQEIKKELCNQNFLLEQYKIKQRISQIKPKLSVIIFQLQINIYASQFFYKICQSIIFQWAKKCCCIGSIICFLILNTTLTTNERIAVYTIHLLFFSAQILLFAFESIVYSKNQDNFTRDLILTISAIPGAYIGFINPVRFSTGSPDLKVILVLFNALTVVRFIKIVNYFSVLQKIYTFLREKMTQTLNTFFCLLIFTISTGFYLYILFEKKQPIIECLNYAFVGLVGGDFYYTIENIIERNGIIFTYEIHLLYLAVNLLAIMFKNLLLAFIIYELSDIAKQRMPNSSVEFNLFNFNKFFHENKFIEEWMKIDPQGKGFVNYSNIMHKSHKFIVTFSVTSIPYKPYLNRIQTFRKLKVPIYEAETIIQKEENEKPQIRREYVVTFYDFLFQMAKFCFTQMNSNKLISKGDFFVKNITFIDQPISIINIGQGDDQRLSNFSKKGDKQDKIILENQEQWKKKCHDLTKSNMRQKSEQYQESPQLSAVLRLTKFTSEQLYFAHRVKHKVQKFLKKVRISNEIKRFEEINRLKHQHL